MKIIFQFIHVCDSSTCCSSAVFFILNWTKLLVSKDTYFVTSVVTCWTVVSYYHFEIGKTLINCHSELWKLMFGALAFQVDNWSGWATRLFVLLKPSFDISLSFSKPTHTSSYPSRLISWLSIVKPDGRYPSTMRHLEKTSYNSRWRTNASKTIHDSKFTLSTWYDGCSSLTLSEKID